MPEKSQTFPAKLRLSGKPRFDAVYDARAKESRGPLTLYSLPNNLPHLRLGLSVSRRVGNAVQRNRIKRYLREAFRLTQHDLPTGYDLIAVVRVHKPLTLADYENILKSLIEQSHRSWARRRPSA